MKKPTLICAMTLRETPRSPDEALQPFFAHGIRGEELGDAVVRFTIYLLFTDGQGEWPVEVNLLNVEGVRTGRPLPAIVVLDNPFSVGSICIETGIRITRFGYSFITVDLEGETIARVPFRIYEDPPSG
jgi:hypothetical protein